MKSRRIFKESYVSNNILSSKIPISPKEESYNSKSSTYKSITKYTKKDVDMIIKIQRWWRSILPKLNKFNKIENSYSKRHIESTRIKKHYSNSSFNDRRINKYENNSNHYKYLSNSLNSNSSYNNAYSNNTNTTSNTNNNNFRKNQNSKYCYNSNTSTRGSNYNYIQTQTITRKSETRSNPQCGSLSTSPSVKSKYLVETKRVEIFRKPRTFNSENKKSSYNELSRNELKYMLKNIWTEESFCSTVESLSIFSDENKNGNLSQNNSNNSIICEQYEEKISELRNLLIEKDEELNNLIKNLSQNKTAEIDYKYNSWNQVNIPSPINEIHIESIKAESIHESLSNNNLSGDDILEIQEINALSIISNITRYKNICQHLQSMTIFSQSENKLIEKDEDLIIQKIEEINITSIIPKLKDQNKIQELDGLEILCINKNKNEENIVQRMDKISIKSLQENNTSDNIIIQELDGFEILKQQKRLHIPQCVDELTISREYDMLLVKPKWNKLKIQGAGLNLFAIKKDNALENQEIDEFNISGKDKPELSIQSQDKINYLNTNVIKEIKTQQENIMTKIEQFTFEGNSDNYPIIYNENNNKEINNNKIEKINNIELVGLNHEIKKEKEKEEKPFLILNIENAKSLEIKKSYETTMLSEKKNWNTSIKPIKTTKLLIKNIKSPKKIIEKEEIETIERIYKNTNMNWTEEIKPIKTTKLKIKGIKIPHAFNELNIEEKININLLNNNSSKEKESLFIESFAFNLDENNKKFDNLTLIENSGFYLKGKDEPRKKIILSPIISQRMMIKNIPKEEKIKIVEKIIEKKINWNESNIPIKNINFNFIHLKENKTLKFKKQKSYNINLIGLELPKPQPEKNWKNLLRAQKSGKFNLQGKPTISKNKKLLIANGDKFFIQKEIEDEIIYNDDYNYNITNINNPNKLKQKAEEKEKEQINSSEIKTQIIKEKEIVPKYQREIRAEIARVKEISESDSSSLSDLDVLEGIKTNKERINNKELIKISNGYQAKKINSEVIYTAKNGIGLNTGGALYQKQIKYDYNKKYNTSIDENKLKIDNNYENSENETSHFLTKILGGGVEEKQFEILKKTDKNNNQKKQIIITNSKMQNSSINNIDNKNDEIINGQNQINKREIIINNSFKKSQKIPTCENRFSNGNQIKKGQIIFNPKIRTSKLQSHYSTNSACLTGRGNIIINSRKIYDKKINEGYSMDNSSVNERKSNDEIKLKRSKIKNVELLRDNDSQQSF